MKTISVMFDNAVNTRFVYDAIMHIFACNNDSDLCITLRTLYNWHLPSWGVPKILMCQTNQHSLAF